MKALSAILIAFSIIISGCSNKEEENKTVQKEPKSKTETQQQSSTETQSGTSNSDVGKIWAQVEKINETMGKGINSDKSGHLEEPVSEIITLLKQIPGKAGNLQPKNLEILISKVNELRKSGDKMDKLHHANNTSELKEEYAKFTLALNEIKSVLPL